MIFTISAITKEGKKFLKQAIKEEGRSLGFGKKNKYKAAELENQLHTLGRVLEEAKQTEIELLITLNDEEGSIEKAGTSYVFEPLVFRISEGFYPTLVDLIREDLFKDTDENMSVEESFRNEKIMEVLEKNLESEAQVDSSNIHTEATTSTEPAPWERPIFLTEDEETSEEKSEIKEIKDKDVSSFDEFEDIKFEQEEIGSDFKDPFEETEEIISQEEESMDTITTLSQSDPLDWTEEKIQQFIEPFFLEEAQKQQEEIKQQTFLEYIQAQFPVEEEWMKEKQKIFLNELYLKLELGQAYKVFVETQQELIAQSRGMLQEQLESVRSINWNELAQEELLATFEEKQEEMNQEVNDYTLQQNQSWEEKKAALIEEEQRVIEEETRKIKEKYEKKREQTYALIVERINQFISDNQDSFLKEKNALLQERMMALKQSYYDSLANDKAKISQTLSEELNRTYQGTLQVVFEKYQKIQEELTKKTPEWKMTHEKEQKMEEARLRAVQKEKQRQEELQTRQKEVALKEAELAMKEKELEQVKEEKRAARQERKEQHELVLEQLRQALLNQYMQPSKQLPNLSSESIKEPVIPKTVNGWMVGCIASISLLIGGGSVATFNHFHQAAQADSVATTESIQEEAQAQAQAIYEKKLQELVSQNSPKSAEVSETGEKENKTKKDSEEKTSQSTKSSEKKTEQNEVK
ncbi:hypothetical protein OU491_002118 [Enterococcus hirae]|nr:hypothetical protein [Enterococcus hirae]